MAQSHRETANGEQAEYVQRQRLEIKIELALHDAQAEVPVHPNDQGTDEKNGEA